MTPQVGQALPPANLFDRQAARYDELWTTTPIGRAQRNLTWSRMDPLFHRGDRILVEAGTYAEQLTIECDKINLAGLSAILVPPGSPTQNTVFRFSRP